MSRSVNKIILIGHVGRDPELRETQNGTKVANLRLATNRFVPSGSSLERERTDWHSLTLWNKLAMFAQDHVQTGDRLFVEGRLEYGSYERDGVTIPTAEISVREMVLLSPKRDGSALAVGPEADGAEND